ncbi:ran-binding protein 1 a [Histomonas meleagridis]|uniref:ran-binding protein 1-like a n=1 Tax=Histomonas meleagridis TaxID=135588 RepID=UPI00355AA131|nr:ran-binding protein 1 a [Histomonas meleagridis]KAH0799151.1 ran-binding protein 1-like a [Histomonas meleagridis]
MTEEEKEQQQQQEQEEQPKIVQPAPSPKVLEMIERTMKQFFSQGDPDTGETATHTSFCVLYRFNEDKYERYNASGQGVVRILKHDDTGRYRIVMRSKEDFDKIYLNHFILPGMDIREKSLEKGNVVIRSKNYADGTLKKEYVLFKFATQEAKDDFIEKYTEALNQNKEILTSK